MTPRTLDRAQARGQVPAGTRDGGDQELANLLGQAGEIVLLQTPQIFGAVNSLEEVAVLGGFSGHWRRSIMNPASSANTLPLSPKGARLSRASA